MIHKVCQQYAPSVNQKEGANQTTSTYNSLIKIKETGRDMVGSLETAEVLVFPYTQSLCPTIRPLTSHMPSYMLQNEVLLLSFLWYHQYPVDSHIARSRLPRGRSVHRASSHSAQFLQRLVVDSAVCHVVDIRCCRCLFPTAWIYCSAMATLLLTSEGFASNSTPRIMFMSSSLPEVLNVGKRTTASNMEIWSLFSSAVLKRSPRKIN